MAWVSELIYGFLRAFLPWFFSGETTTKVRTHAGLADMDREYVSGTNGLSAKDLPALLLAGGCLFWLSGCAFGGAKVEHTYHLVEPGAVVEAVAGKVKVRAPGTDAVGDYDPIGKVIMPKSVYREMRAAWIEKHPETETKGP